MCIILTRSECYIKFNIIGIGQVPAAGSLLARELHVFLPSQDAKVFMQVCATRETEVILHILKLLFLKGHRRELYDRTTCPGTPSTSAKASTRTSTHAWH